ncbi:UDP-3-O-(3-hydroxymyristoyl)glucosamine N-acyltransferase [Pusillimonas sp.]|uniref:UDP-3-O-(3-hydroxymyristoyl)glucosamine N-acyltransferase n=1 Tax=Pusillimonas sp. TaxID=3040095 RepID=UPI0037CA9144
MPVLLAPEKAPTLPGLLQEANLTGLDTRIVESDQPMPRIQGLGSLLGAGPTEISFLANPRLQGQLAQCRAAAVILTPEAWQSLQDEPLSFRVVLCSQPYLMYALLAQWFDQHRIQSLAKGIHPNAVIAPSAQIADGVSIGPHCIIEDDASIGKGTRLGPGCVIGAGSSIGTDGLLHARVTLYHGVRVGDRAIVHSGAVLGADGFGFAPYPGSEKGAWAKIAQLGGVRIGHDVEIGANTTIDRGALEDTAIGDGVKLDNQIMVAHNVHIGDHTAIAACVGIAGSTTIGARCTIGGASMISGHLVLGDDVHVSGGTAITSNVDKPGRYTGVYPFDEHAGWQRNAATLGQLSQLRRRLKALEKQGNN